MARDHFQARFTLCGSRLLDERIKQELRYIVHFLLEHHRSISARPAVIWLGGSYGRGEGAVYRQQNNEKPWFDYDIFIIYRQAGYENKTLKAYQNWRMVLENRLNISVDIRSLGDLLCLEQLKPSLMNYDLFYGHQVLWGDSSLLAGMKTPAQPGGEMALRLLVYWGGQILRLGDQEGRNRLEGMENSVLMDLWYRSASAIGDACLLARQDYHVSLQERAQRYQKWQIANGRKWIRELGYLYQEAMQYRIQPSDFSRHGKHILRRHDKLLELFVKAYLYILETHLQHPTPLENLEQVFWTHTPSDSSLKSQLRSVRENFKLFRGQSFHSHWYSRPLIDRLYFLLPYLLLQDKKPARETLHWLCPGLRAEASWQEMNAYFMKIWDQLADQLI